ncbi:hypothetical protein ACOME3_004544 [Neoechinorhynchus agilis]
MLSLSCFLMSVSLIWSKSDSDPKQHPLVVLVVDGLKHGFSQYFSPLYDSKLHTLMENGIYARLKSVFPAETLPNLQSIATGKLAGEHGIVSDTMFDIGRYKFFNSSMENSWDAGWYLVNRNVKSIWHANEIREGYRSACIGYPGCCAKRKGFPIVSYCLPARTAKRVPRVLDEIHVLLSEGYQFIIAYVQDLGKILRRGGITNKRLLEELGELDYRLGEAIDDMKVFGQWNRVNLLILGATGIMNYDFKATPIIISDYVQFRGFITFGRGPSVQIYQNALRPKWKQLKKLDTIPNVLVIMRNDLWKYLGNVSDIRNCKIVTSLPIMVTCQN